MSSSEDVSQISILLRFIGGVEVAEGSEGSGDCKQNLLSCRSAVGSTTTILAKMLKRSGGRFKSFRLGVIFGSSHPILNGIVGSFVSDSFVMIFGSGDVTDDNIIIPLVWIRDKTLGLSTIEVFVLGGRCSPDDCST